MGNLFYFIKTYILEVSLLLLVMLVYGLTIHPAGLGQSEEIYFIQTAREMFLTENWGLPVFNQAPIFHVPPFPLWLEILSFQFGGVSFLAAQIPAVLLGALGIGLVYGLGLSLFNNRASALLSALMLASTWGYFKLSHTVTHHIVLSTLLILFVWLFYLWFQRAGRPKLYDYDIKALSVGMGIAASLLILSQGILPLLGLAFIGLLFLTCMRSLYLLGRFHWKWLLGCLVIIVSPWILWMTFQPGQEAFALDFLVNTPLRQLMGLSLEGLYLKTLALDLMPWGLFLIPALLEPGRIRRVAQLHPEAMIILSSWFLMGCVLYLLSADKNGMDFLVFLPPLVLIIGTYLVTTLLELRPSKPVLGMFDIIILLFLVAAVCFTLAIFQVLPDAYPGQFWTLPGPTLIQKIELFHKEVMLPYPVSVWKFWLLSGPLLLLGSAITLYYLTLTERSQYVPGALIVCTLLMYLNISLLVCPIMNRPVGLKFAEVLNQRLKPDDEVVLYSKDDHLFKVLFFLKYRPGHPVRIFTEPKKLESFLAFHRYQTSIFGMMDEDDYYRLDADYRAQMRVLQNEWRWRSPGLKKLLYALHDEAIDFTQMTHQLLLFETLPRLSEVE